MSSVLETNDVNSIGITFNLWKRSSLNLFIFTNSLKSLEVEDISLILTLISLMPLNLLNFWSIRTLKTLAWVSKGISETSSINNVPLLALSRAPKEIFPSCNSSPNSSFSYVFSFSKAAFIITKGSFDLDEFLWIFLATSSLPVPVGPDIKTLLSEVDNFSIIFLP